MRDKQTNSCRCSTVLLRKHFVFGSGCEGLETFFALVCLRAFDRENKAGRYPFLWSIHLLLDRRVHMWIARSFHVYLTPNCALPLILHLCCIVVAFQHRAGMETPEEIALAAATAGLAQHILVPAWGLKVPRHYLLFELVCLGCVVARPACPSPISAVILPFGSASSEAVLIVLLQLDCFSSPLTVGSLACERRSLILYAEVGALSCYHELLLWRA